MADLDSYGSDDEDEEDSSSGYLSTCICGHGVMEHGADASSLGDTEFKRRGRVAVRLDELLKDVNRLLDFDYIDDDIANLRLQMGRFNSRTSSSSQTHSSPANEPASPVSSVLSDVPPPSKRRRVSESSLSDADDDDDDDDDENKPLAARMSIKTAPDGSRTATAGKRSGKKMKSKGHVAPTSIQPPTGREQAEMNGHINGVNGHARIKLEEKLDESQLDRLATGVTVDTSNPEPPVKTEKAAVTELRKGIIQITPVENDAQPRSLVILTGLKTLFQKQLPKMPREYIARLVYDSNSRGLAIIKRGYKVVGGICFRPFPHRGFAEIVFFATASVDQIKGYGGMLMDHFKAHILQTYPGMLHFLTYADNYAVGYFRKQGFSKEITLDRAVWAGYIKDYEGGTIMQCTMVRKVDYLDKANIIAQQREAILNKIREMSRSHIVYAGLPQFQDGAGEGVTVDVKDIPGLLPRRSAEHTFLQHLLSDLQGHSQAWPFLHPVPAEDVEDYYDVIKRPMGDTMEHKLETNQYASLRGFIDDAQLIFDNCRLYNPEGSVYAKAATKMEKFLKDQVAERLKSEA
ncbi:hypothetical protein HWV62_15966 [Athelia sp. TMB]|nr:hypothetical protein HWV62_15966 [Athelia sp. TMB]